MALGSVLLLTHWGRVTHICVAKLTIIGSDNGLSPDRRQAIIWTNAGMLLIGPLGTNLSEILIEILTFSFKKMRLKVSSAKRRPSCLGLNVLKCCFTNIRNPIINILRSDSFIKILSYQYRDSPWWRHQMETFSALLAICEGIHRSPVNSLHKGQWRGALMFSLICARINGWVNNREAGDLRRHRAVMASS